MILPSKIVTAARTWLGTPYQHQQRLKGHGVDCIGLVIGVAWELTLWPKTENKTGYGREPFNGLLRDNLAEHMIEVSQPEPGTVALIRWLIEPQHCAIVTGDDSIIHAYGRVGKCVEHRFSDVWKKRAVTYFRFPGVAYG